MASADPTTPSFPFARPLYVMAKPAGAACNLACDYCYYLEKSDLYPSASKTEMSDELLELFIRQYIEAQTGPEAIFTWHGGEALLRPLSFYKKALRLQDFYGRAKGVSVLNTLQTNGTLLNDEWCAFFRDNGFLVGISLDGPQAYHDAFRKNRAGRSSFDRVVRGVKLLQKHGVEYNILAVVNSLNGHDPVGFYRFFKELGCRYLQFTPIVERSDGHALAHILRPDLPVTPQSVTPGLWGDFLIGLFDEWVRHDVGEVFVQLFDATLANWAGEPPGLCTMGKYCGHAAVLEHNGDLYSCDHFVFPEFFLGNIRSRSITELMESGQQRRFGRDKHDTLPRQCLECEYLFACQGECPKNRFARTEEGEPGLNYLCEGYFRFFRHAAPYMDWMREALRRGEPPAGISALFRK